MPPATKVVVRLTDEQRDALEGLLRSGSHPAAMRCRAGILLRADADGPDAWTDEQIADELGTTRMTVMRVRPQFAAEGVAASDIASEEGLPRGEVPEEPGEEGGLAGLPLAGEQGDIAGHEEAVPEPAGSGGGDSGVERVHRNRP